MQGENPTKARAPHSHHLSQLWRPNSNPIKEGEKKLMITQRQRLRIKREMAEEKPTIWIGKNGVTEEIIKEASNQLEKNQVVKIKILKNILKSENAEALARELAEKTESTLIEVRGHSLTLYRVKKKLKGI